MAERGITLVIEPEARECLIDKGYSPDFGARPLRRAIERLVEDHLSEEILRGTYEPPCEVVARADAKKEKLLFVARPAPEPAGDEEGKVHDEAVAPAGEA